MGNSLDDICLQCEGKRIRRPRLRWVDCLERDTRRRSRSGEWWPGMEDSRGGSSKGWWERVATLTPESGTHGDERNSNNKKFEAQIMLKVAQDMIMTLHRCIVF